MTIIPTLRADPMEDLVRIHREAIGGERIAQCRAIEAAGTVQMGGRELKFYMVAARPNRVRLTVSAAGRTLVQATDGVAPPWQADSTKTPTTQAMKEGDAQEFAADAEFDDPLVSAPERGFVLDYAGEAKWDGRRMLKVLVTRADTAPSFLLIDPDTYFIMARQVTMKQASGRTATIETRYDDFRPVAGVIIPHRIDVVEDGRAVRTTVMTEVRGVPEPAPEIFVRPLLGDGTGAR